MKTDNFFFASIILVFLISFIGTFASLTIDNYIKSKKDLEFAKLGYVQKVESNKVIWVKQ